MVPIGDAALRHPMPLRLGLSHFTRGTEGEEARIALRFCWRGRDADL